MPRARQEVTSATFAKGIITETGPLGYPDNAVKDMNNLVLERNGSVHVRNGIVLDNFGAIQDINKGDTYSIHYWKDPAGDGENFIVLQIGHFIKCLSTRGDHIGKKQYTASTLSNGQEVTDLTDIFNFGGQIHDLDSVQSKNRLYMTSKETSCFYLEYLPEGRLNSDSYSDYPGATADPTVQITSIDLKYRDLYGIHDGFKVDERPTSPDNAHRYNLLNSGWKKEHINKFYAGRTGHDEPDWPGGKYPANADYYWFGWGINPYGEGDVADHFLPGRYYEYPISTTPAPKGKFILNVLNPDREKVSGVGNLPKRGKAAGPTSIGFYAGRVWYAGFSGGGFDDNILFSNVLPFDDLVEYKDDQFYDVYAGQCYQKNDPSARDVNDLVDDDGGIIPIPGLGKVQGITSLSSSLLVISDQGAWAISGGIDPFSANNYSVNKITDIGCVSPTSITEMGGSIAYWGLGSIVVIGQNQMGSTQAESATYQTIESIYSRIPLDEKRTAHGTYDDISKKVYWTYSQNKCLIFDVQLGAFSRYTFTDEIEGIVLLPTINDTVQHLHNNVVLHGSQVTLNGEDVGFEEEIPVDADTRVLPIIKKDNYIIPCIFAPEDSGIYYDLLPPEYGSLGYDLYPVHAFLEVGATNFGDIMRRKQSYRALCYFESMESLAIPTDYSVANGEMSADNLNFIQADESGCWVQARWDWS
ncbi:MAG TPA: hypothetical protein VK031_02680, partial [Tissierellaceae bacterium]|nr:hypothetical protein [Tissierellaceae bacterium]